MGEQFAQGSDPLGREGGPEGLRTGDVGCPDVDERQSPDVANPIGGPVKGGVVNHHDVAVRGHLHIALDQGDAVFDRAVEGREGVLRSRGRVAAVTDDQGHCGPALPAARLAVSSKTLASMNTCSSSGSSFPCFASSWRMARAFSTGTAFL